MTDKPLILWFRRDLRLGDHPMLAAALATGRPLIPLFILDSETESLGAAPKWRLGLSVERFARDLASVGSRLTLRRGDALAVLQALIAETGAAGVMWQRMYDPAAKARDTAVKAALKARSLVAESHAGGLLFEPWDVQTGTGGYYKVYSPFWRAVSGRDVAAPLPAPKMLPAPVAWPASDDLAGWKMGAAMRRGRRWCCPISMWARRRRWRNSMRLSAVGWMPTNRTAIFRRWRGRLRACRRTLLGERSGRARSGRRDSVPRIKARRAQSIF